MSPPQTPQGNSGQSFFALASGEVSSRTESTGQGFLSTQQENNYHDELKGMSAKKPSMGGGGDDDGGGGDSDGDGGDGSDGSSDDEGVNEDEAVNTDDQYSNSDRIDEDGDYVDDDDDADNSPDEARISHTIKHASVRKDSKKKGGGLKSLPQNVRNIAAVVTRQQRGKEKQVAKKVIEHAKKLIFERCKDGIGSLIELGKISLDTLETFPDLLVECNTPTYNDFYSGCAESLRNDLMKNTTKFKGEMIRHLNKLEQKNGEKGRVKDLVKSGLQELLEKLVKGDAQTHKKKQMKIPKKKKRSDEETASKSKASKKHKENESDSVRLGSSFGGNRDYRQDPPFHEDAKVNMVIMKQSMDPKNRKNSMEGDDFLGLQYPAEKFPHQVTVDAENFKKNMYLRIRLMAKRYMPSLFSP